MVKHSEEKAVLEVPVNSWNIVLNKFIEIKNAFIKKFGKEALYNLDYENETCLETWVRWLDIPEYIDLIEPLQLNQDVDLLLIRYGQYSNIFDGESDVGFWDKHNGIYRECRSVVINWIRNELCLTPFKKFFNLNEMEETSLENITRRIENAGSIEISDKIDGSMQSARYYRGGIVMSGSQAIDINKSWRLEYGYNWLVSKPNYVRMLRDYPDYTFIFELVTKEDEHVVIYPPEEDGLHLIGIRNVTNGKELSYNEIITFASRYDIKTTKVFNMTFDEVLSSLDDKKSNEAEGFVVNIDGYKIKIKYNDYVYMHKILSKASSPNMVIRAIADGTYDDFKSKIPTAYRQNIENFAYDVFLYKKDIEDQIDYYYKELYSKDRKTFMIDVNNYVPKLIRSYVIARYLGKKYNVLKNGTSYKRKKDICQI